jgi:hypothetical protein
LKEQERESGYEKKFGKDAMAKRRQLEERTL